MDRSPYAPEIGLTTGDVENDSQPIADMISTRTKKIAWEVVWSRRLFRCPMCGVSPAMKCRKKLQGAGTYGYGYVHWERRRLLEKIGRWFGRSSDGTAQA